MGFLFSSVPRITVFILSVSNTSVTPPKYSNPCIRQRMKVLTSHRFVNSTYMALEYPSTMTKR